MIYKFKSKATGDVIMLQPHGDQVLRVLGKEPSAKGIIEVAAMPAFIAAIESAINADELARERAVAQAAEEGTRLPPRDISLRQRAWPLVEMMRRAHAAQHEIVWGV